MNAARRTTVRIGDAERDAATSALARHFAEGRLTPLEHEERSALALSARTEADLDALFADLPSLPPPTVARSRSAVVGGAVAGGSRVLIAAVIVAALFVSRLHVLPLLVITVVAAMALRGMLGHRHHHRHWHGTRSPDRSRW